MTGEERSRQWRSASHYLTEETLAARLRPTLVLAARTLGFPIGMVNILDQNTQHTIAMLGDHFGVSTPREDSFCNVVVGGGEPLVVEDARADERFAGLSVVADGRALS